MIGSISGYVVYISRLIIIVTILLTDAFCTKCFKDDNIGDVEGNVYHCNDADKPECCEENQEFTCCQSQSQKTLEEQLILWGSVIGVCILIALIFCCLFKDVKCCGSETSLRQKCCCKCCRKKEDDVHIEPAKLYKSKYEPFPPRGRNSIVEDEDLKIRPDSSSSKRAGSSWYQYY